MPTLTTTIPAMLEAALKEAVADRGTSPDNLIGATLSEHLDSHRHRIFQISTSTALVEGVEAHRCSASATYSFRRKAASSLRTARK
jgi:hypothetical protein